VVGVGFRVAGGVAVAGAGFDGRWGQETEGGALMAAIRAFRDGEPTATAAVELARRVEAARAAKDAAIRGGATPSARRAAPMPELVRLPVRRFYRTGELRRLFGVSPKYLNEWIDKGMIAGFRLPDSNERRVTFGSLVAFITAHPEFGITVADAFEEQA
jgi:hypothetical protein